MISDVAAGQTDIRRVLSEKNRGAAMTEDTISATGKSQGEIVIYLADGGDTKIDVRFVDETVWLTQAQLYELYQTSKSNVREHFQHQFIEERESDEDSVVRKFRTTAADGKQYNVTHYNPSDMADFVAAEITGEILFLHWFSGLAPWEIVWKSSPVTK